jgi:hypothetical protein
MLERLCRTSAGNDEIPTADRDWSGRVVDLAQVAAARNGSEHRPPCQREEERMVAVCALWCQSAGEREHSGQWPLLLQCCPSSRSPVRRRLSGHVDHATLGEEQLLRDSLEVAPLLQSLPSCGRHAALHCCAVLSVGFSRCSVPTRVRGIWPGRRVFAEHRAGGDPGVSSSPARKHAVDRQCAGRCGGDDAA